MAITNNGINNSADNDLYINSLTNDGASETFDMRKSRAGAVITSGDTLGAIFFSGYDGSNFIPGAKITSTSSGTIAAGRVAANLVFLTHPDSASVATTRMTIAPTGEVTIAAPDSGTGLTVGSGLTVSAGTTALSALSTAGIVYNAVTTGALSSHQTTDHNIQVGNASGQLGDIAPSATSGVPLISQGAAADPAFGTAVVAGGGTGATTLTNHGLLIGQATSPIAAMSAGTAGQIVTSSGAAADPAWTTATYPATSAQGDILYSSAANTIAGLTKDTNATRYLSNTGASNNPAWAQVDVSNGITGVVPIANGGTNASSMATTYGVNYFDGTRIVTTAVGTATHVLTSNGAGVAPTFQAATGAVSSVSGTANQVTCSPATGAVIVSLPSAITCPGSLTATTTLTATSGDITITSGDLQLPVNTSTTVGVIRSKNLDGGGVAQVCSFIHKYGNSGASNSFNLFVGDFAGNFTLTAGTSRFNTALGHATTTKGALGSLTSGVNNVALGFGALLNTSSGSGNTAVGCNALINLSTGSANIAIGNNPGVDFAGSAYTTESSNIALNSTGVAGDANVLRIGQATGSSVTYLNKAFICGITGIVPGVASTQGVVVDTSNQLGTDNSVMGFGTAATAKAVTIGTTTTTSSLALKYGTGDYTLASATGTVVSALDSGEVTMPLQPAFSAYLPSTASNVTGNGAVYTLGSGTALTEVFDQNGDFNTNGTFTAPVTGKYWLRASVRASGITALMTLGYIQVVTSNRSFEDDSTNPETTEDFQIEVLADMDAADTATFTVTISNGAGDTADIDGSGSPYVSYCAGFLAC